jgi:type II secretion system protein J
MKSERLLPVSRRGFTLVEVLLTMTIMALMLVAISQMLTAARTTRDVIQNVQETQLAGPAILDMIERDLRGLMTMDLPRTSEFRLKNRVVLGYDADGIDFITTTDNVNWTENGDRFVRADWCEVGYCLRPSPENDDFLELYRREDFGVDSEPFTGGTYTFLHDRVKSFDVRAFAEDGEDAEPIEEWNVDPTDPETQGLPARLEITMTLEIAPRLIREQLVIDSKEQRTIEYRRVIRIPEILRVAAQDIPRPAIPVAGGSASSGSNGETKGEGETEKPADEGAPAGDEGGGKAATRGDK